MNRLYAIESTPTLTGAKADHRLRLRASEVEGIARELAAAITGSAAPAPSAGGRTGAADVARWVAAIAKDLQAHKGRSVVVAGDFQTDARARRRQSDQRRARQHRHDGALRRERRSGARTGRQPRSSSSRKAIDAGQVELLVIMGGNPVFTAPVDLRFAERLTKVPLVVYHSTHADETVAALPLERRRDTPARKLGRCAIVRRHRHADAAADRSALRRTVGARFPGRVHGAARAPRRWRSSRISGRRRTAAAPAAGRSRIRAARASRMPMRSGARRCTMVSSPGTSLTEGAPGTTLTPASAAAPATAAADTAARRPPPPAAVQQAPAPRLRPLRPRPLRPRRAASKSSSGPIRPSGTAASPTTAGSRNCRSRIPRSPGTLRRGSARGSPRSAACAKATSSSCAIAATPCACRCSWSPGIRRSRSRCSSATAAAAPAASAMPSARRSSSTRSCCAPRTRRGSAAASSS